MFTPNTRILIVDDMKTLRMVMKKTLNGLGFENITEADDGDTAWKAIEASLPEQKPFQLIISDWTMARMSGLDLLKAVRAHVTMSKVPFMMVTAEADAAQVKEAAMAGVSGYVTKPFNADILKEKIEGVWKKFNS